MSVDACPLDFYRQVEPFARLGPAYIELPLGRLHQVVRIVVNLVVKLGIGGVHSFVHAELV